MGLALLFAFGLAAVASPAAASLLLTVEVLKTKSVDVTIEIDITKNVFVDVDLVETFDGDAEALVNVNVENVGNVVMGCDKSCPNGSPDGPDGPNDDATYGVRRISELVGSVNGNTGVLGVNQDSGNLVNQGNSLALSNVEVVGDKRIVVHAEAAADQQNRDNTIWHYEVENPHEVNHHASILNSIGTAGPDGNGNTGLVSVNQNAGNANNQHTGLAFAYSAANAVALSEAELGQVNQGNTVDSENTVRRGSIVGSIQYNEGVVQVNQSAGNLNNQASMIAVSALAAKVSIDTVPGS
jgi:hypothetical protein